MHGAAREIEDVELARLVLSERGDAEIAVEQDPAPALAQAEDLAAAEVAREVGPDQVRDGELPRCFLIQR